MSDTATPTPIVAVKQLVKHFAAVTALDGVDLAFHAAQVHGLVGENGAGKSTLMNIIDGVHRPTSGQVRFGGRPVTLYRPVDAMRQGVAMIHQELNLIDELSVADNIHLGREKAVLGFVPYAEACRQAREVMQSFGCNLDPRQRVARLSIAEKQMVEIARAVACEARIIIMDEPTAVLTQREVKLLFRLIARLRGRGVAVIYISHILPEVLQICNRITVMRDGKIVRSVPRDELPVGPEAETTLANWMVGRDLSQHFPPRGEHGQAIALGVSHYTVPGHCRDVSFNVKKGEIFGLAGLIGAGRTELAEAIVGLRRYASGQLHLGGQPVTVRSIDKAIQCGIAYLSEDRRGRALTMGMSVEHNITLVSLRRYSRLLIDRKAERQAALQRVQQLGIKAGHLSDPIQTLSGGNQQKVAVARWLETEPRIIILDEPTRGVDIGAKEEIYRLIKQLAGKGMTCIMISSELNELIGMCHRIGVMRQGRLAATIDGESATEEQIMHHAAGVTGANVA